MIRYVKEKKTSQPLVPGFLSRAHLKDIFHVQHIYMVRMFCVNICMLDSKCACGADYKEKQKSRKGQES